MKRMIECEGDPRAMGHCQGLVFRAEIQQRLHLDSADIRRSRLPRLRGLTRGPVLGSGTGREVIRHYAHLAERMAGMARNSDVSLEALMHSFSCSVDAPSPRDASMQGAETIGALRIADLESGGVVRAIPGFGERDASWFIRKSCPEVGFASVEVTQPWLPSAVGGINEAGVAVAWVGEANEAPPHAHRTPHNVLLVQECLQRFEDVAGCIDWCNKRPHSGNARLILFDRPGNLVAVALREGFVHVIEPRDGIVLGALSPERTEAIDAARGSSDGLRLADVGQSVGSDHAVLVLEPRSCRLTLRTVSRPDEILERVELDR